VDTRGVGVEANIRFLNKHVAMKRTILVSAALWILATVPSLPDVTHAQSGLLFSSDLAFQFICKDKARSALEKDFEDFLQREGFKVLNQGKIQREHGVFVFDTQIIGLDDKKRTIDVIALPGSEGRYAVRLRTPPPTQRVVILEGALLKFVSDKLACEVRQIARGENGADAKAYYDQEISRIENLFREAAEMEGRRQL
jgi:hypothetical protein